MSNTYIFSSESVGEGHPDKVCDTISDYVLDACLRVDKMSRVACECYAKSNTVIVGGEITVPRLGYRNPSEVIDFVGLARQAIRDIGYVNEDDVFHAEKVFVNCLITGQSPDIAQGVDARKAVGKKTAKQGAGDQGLMFGYACDETPELMPAPIMFAHRLGRKLTEIRKSGKVPWLRPDAKSQVSVAYVDGKPAAITNVVISTQHTREVEHREIEKFCIEHVIQKVLPKKLLNSRTEYLINPTGRFVVGGPQGDTGLTGRKIIVDSYGGMGRHGGGAPGTIATWIASTPGRRPASASTACSARSTGNEWVCSFSSGYLRDSSSATALAPSRAPASPSRGRIFAAWSRTTS